MPFTIQINLFFKILSIESCSWAWSFRYFSIKWGEGRRKWGKAGLEKGPVLRAFFLLRTSLFAAVWNPKANSATAWFGECWRFGSAGGIEVGEINKMVGYWFHEVQLFTVELLVNNWKILGSYSSPPTEIK